MEVHRHPIGTDAGGEQRAHDATHVGGTGDADRVADRDLVHAEVEELARHPDDGRLADGSPWYGQPKAVLT